MKITLRCFGIIFLMLMLSAASSVHSQSIKGGNRSDGSVMEDSFEDDFEEDGTVDIEENDIEIESGEAEYEESEFEDDSFNRKKDIKKPQSQKNNQRISDDKRRFLLLKREKSRHKHQMDKVMLMRKRANEMLKKAKNMEETELMRHDRNVKRLQKKGIE